MSTNYNYLKICKQNATVTNLCLFSIDLNIINKTED